MRVPISVVNQCSLFLKGVKFVGFFRACQEIYPKTEDEATSLPLKAQDFHQL